jgi:hypothetical protein
MSTVLSACFSASHTAVKRCTGGRAECENYVVARRYCDATSSGVLSRGCICRLASEGRY